MQLVQDEWDDPTAKVWIGNPTPVVDLMDPKHPGRIWLVFTRSNARMFVTSSDDNGATWSERREITPDGRQTGLALVCGGAGARDSTYARAARRATRRSVRPPLERRMRRRRLGFAPGLQRRPRQDVEARRGRHASGGRSAPSERMCGGGAGRRPDVRECPRAQGSDPATRTVAYSSDGGETFDAPFVAEPQITSPVVQNSLIRFAAKDQGDERECT